MRKLSRKSEARAAKSREQVRREFREAGITIAEWARERGLNPALVYTLLCVDRPAIRGESHRAAVELGLKAQMAEAMQ